MSVSRILRRVVLLAGVVALSLLALSCTATVDVRAPSLVGLQEPFPDFGQVPPPDYDGRFFRMRQDYPARQPSQAKNLYPWLSIDFNQDWVAYITALKDHCLEGNVETDFVLQNNKVRDWYHVPWQHYGGQGREFVYGLTSEIANVPGTFGPTQTRVYGTYAVGFYNAPGAYTIGKVWENHQQPNPAAAKFPQGTMVCKILFTDAPADQAPQLQGTPSITAWVPVQASNDPSTNPQTTPRQLKKLQLVQMDLAARDDRAYENGGTGWIFSTYTGNGRLGQIDPWKNIEPVGLMWGNDPGVSSGVIATVPVSATNFNPDIKQSKISTSPTLWPQHLGWGGRLNGPVDATRSSCLSCHSTAQAPAISGMIAQGNPGTPQWMYWFRNVKAGEPFDAGRAQSLDYSMQLATGIQHFYTAKSLQVGGYYANQFEGNAEFPLRRGGQ